MLKKPSSIPRILVWAFSLLLVAGVGARIALKIYLPPEKIRAIVVSKAQKVLHREVRLEDISLSVLRGLTLKGLEISEAPNFKAGKFASFESFQVMIKLRPLLDKKIIVGRVALKGLSLKVVKKRDGQFNFSDLLGTPEGAKKAEAKASEGEPMAFETDIKFASLSGGRVDYSDLAAGQTWRVSELRASARDLSFDEPFRLEAGLEAQQLSQAMKVALSFEGKIDLSQQADGKITAGIENLTLDVPGIKLDVSGPFKMDKDSIEISKLTGHLNAAALSLVLMVKDYAKSPRVNLDVTLSELNLSQLAAAQQPKDKAEGKESSQAPASPPPAAPASAPIAAKGKITVGKMIYSGLSANELTMSWDLEGITPDLKSLGGWAKLNSTGGSFVSDKGSNRSKLVKALLLPITILQKIGSLGGLKLIPDFRNMLFTEIVGDYTFSRGVMTLRDFHMRSAAANIFTKGTIDLPAQKLDLKIATAVAKVAPLEIEVGGTFDKPAMRVNLGKTLGKTILQPTKILTEPAKKLFNSIFKKDK